MVKSSISYLLVTTAVFILVGSVNAGLVSIDFEEDSLGAKNNGFESVDSDKVTFTDSFGSDLAIIGPLSGTDGQSLAIQYDDASYLIMDFVENSINLSLTFGNDDPGYAVEGDTAVLTLYLDDEQVAHAEVLMNLNDIMDQSIAINGVEFNKATFILDIAEFGLIEIVDNIKFTAVPEPATMIMLAIGGLLIRKRKA